MNNTISISRTGLLLRNLWVEQQRYIWIYICTNIILVGFVLGTNIVSRQFIIFTLGMIANLFITTNCLKWYLRNRALNYTLFPATNFEKFLAVLLSLIIGFAGYILFFMLLNTTYNFIFSQWLQPLQPVDETAWEYSLFPSFFALNPIKWVLTNSTKIYNEQLLYITGLIAGFLSLITLALIITPNSNKRATKHTLIAFGILLVLWTGIKASGEKAIINNPPSLPNNCAEYTGQTIVLDPPSPLPMEAIAYTTWGAALCLFIAAYYGTKEKEIY